MEAKRKKEEEERKKREAEEKKQQVSRETSLGKFKKLLKACLYCQIITFRRQEISWFDIGHVHAHLNSWISIKCIITKVNKYFLGILYL